MKKLNKKGFTLAELLVVVAIIAVLVAIAIPIFSAATDKAQDAVYQANCRTALAEATVDFLGDDDLDEETYEYGTGGTFTAEEKDGVITITGTDGWTCSTDNPTPIKNNDN